MSEPTFTDRMGVDPATYEAATGQPMLPTPEPVVTPPPAPTPAPEPTPASAPGPVVPPFNYYVWLADGSVARTVDLPVSPRFTKPDGSDVAIVGVYPR